jgi:cytochrome c oxidase cbb3-type subunit 4
MTITLFQSIWTIVVMITFLAIVWWAYSALRKTAFDQAARLPLEDDYHSVPVKKPTE